MSSNTNPPRCCIRCDRLIRADDASGFTGQDVVPILYDAVIFRGTGNYGSTIYDPMDGGEFLEIYVCDECLKERANHIVHIEERKLHREVTGIGTLAERQEAKGGGR